MSPAPSMHASSSGRRRCIRVISADEAPLFRDALARTIRQDSALELVDEAANTGELVAAIARQSPDVVLVDAALLDDDALAAVRSTRVLVMTEAVDAPAAYAAVEAGAAGYLSKDVEGQVICRTVATIARGGTVLDPCVQTGIGNEIRLRARDERPLLSAREHEILVLIAAGLTTPAIARRLGVSTATAKTHQQHLYEKLGVGERAAAVAAAMRKGLIE
jgi:two-component system nitrate/nitrite response regulator NarL